MEHDNELHCYFPAEAVAVDREAYAKRAASYVAYDTQLYQRAQQLFWS